jgi:hypothetical protein
MEATKITLELLRRYAIACSLFKATTRKRGIDRLRAQRLLFGSRFG